MYLYMSRFHTYNEQLSITIRELHTIILVRKMVHFYYFSFLFRSSPFSFSFLYSFCHSF